MCFTQPYFNLLSKAFSETSAITDIHPNISPALGYAPLIPPNPEDTKTTPYNESFLRYFLAAFNNVNVVPCTIP